jgi:hypothetical protein
MLSKNQCVSDGVMVVCDSEMLCEYFGYQIKQHFTQQNTTTTTKQQQQPTTTTNNNNHAKSLDRREYAVEFRRIIFVSVVFVRFWSENSPFVCSLIILIFSSSLSHTQQLVINLVMRPAPPKDRVKLRPGPPKPTRLNSIPSRPSSSDNNEGIKLLEKDLQIITKKLTDLKKATVEESSLSRNGIGLSNSVPILTNEETIKLQLTEKIMVKLTEVDREVLNKTGDTMMSRARRSSRDGLLGSDLSCLPAHLTLVDRLLDFHVLVKRNEASSAHNFSSSTTQSSRGDTSHESKQQDVCKYTQIIKEKDVEIAKLKASLEGKESEVLKCTSQLKAKDADIKLIHSKHSAALEELKNKNKHTLEEQKKQNQKRIQEEVDHQQSVIQSLQRELRGATAITSARSPEDTAYIKELEDRIKQVESERSSWSSKEDTLKQTNNFLAIYLEKAIDSLGSDVISTSPEDVVPIIEAADNQVNRHCASFIPSHT